MSDHKLKRLGVSVTISDYIMKTLENDPSVLRNIILRDLTGKLAETIMENTDIGEVVEEPDYATQSSKFYLEVILLKADE
jgi:hypothetical protein